MGQPRDGDGRKLFISQEKKRLSHAFTGQVKKDSSRMYKVKGNKFRMQKSTSRGKKHHQAAKRQTSFTKNRFRFKNFGDQIDGIAFEKIQRFGISSTISGSNLGKADEKQSWFGLALQEWRELNLTTDFATFVGQVYKMAESITQVIFHKDQIIKLLEDGLLNGSSLSLSPFCALTATLTRDLAEEMLPYFNRLFEGFLSALERTEEADTMELVLGSLFLFIKSLLPDVDKPQVLAYLLKGIKNKKRQGQINDFLAEFAVYIISRHFTVELLKMVLEQFDDKDMDLFGCILAGSLREKKSIEIDRLAHAVCFLDSYNYLLCYEMLLSMIDRYGPNDTWTAIATLISSPPSLEHSSMKAIDSILLPAITKVYEGYSARLISEHGKLLNSLCTLPKTTNLQNALVYVLSKSDLHVILPQRQALAERLLDPRGIGLLCNISDQLIEPILGCSKAIKTIIDSLYKKDKKLAALELTGHLSSICNYIPQTGLDLFDDIKSRDFSLAVRAIKLLSKSSSVDSLEVSKLLNSIYDHFPIDQWIELLHIAACHIVDNVIDFSPLIEHIEKVTVLELFTTNSVNLESLFDVNTLLPLLTTTDAKRRQLTLQLLARRLPESLPMLETCMKIEDGQWTFSSDREKAPFFKDLEITLSKTSNGKGLEIEIVTRFIVGLLLMGFQPIKKNVHQILTILADQHSNMTKKILIETFDRLNNRQDSKGQISSLNTQASTASTANAVGSIDDLLMGIIPPRIALQESPFFSDNAVAPFIHFLAQRPITVDLIIDSFLALCEKMFSEDSCSSWFSVKLQSCLADLLTCFSGLRSSKRNVEYNRLVSGILYKFLATGDAAIQKRALSAIIQLYGGVGLYEERLNRLLSSGDIRDELVLLASEQEALCQSDLWSTIRYILIRILYGQLISRKRSKSGRESLATKRKFILNYISIWDIESKHEFVSFIRPSTNGVGDMKKWIGTLNLMHTVLVKFGKKLGSHTFSMLFDWIEEAHKKATGNEKGEEAEEAEGDEEEDVKTVKRLVIKRIYDMYAYAGDSLGPFTERVWKLIKDKIQKLSIEHVQQSSSLFDLLYLWISNSVNTTIPSTNGILFTVGRSAWIPLAKMFAAPKAKSTILVKALEIWTMGLQIDEHGKIIDNDGAIDILITCLDQKISMILQDVKQHSGALLGGIIQLLLKLPKVEDKCSRSLTSSLVQLLSLKGTKEELKTKMLRLLYSTYTDKYNELVYPVAINLLETLTSREARFALAELFTKISLAQACLQLPAKILVDLHAPSKDQIGEYDYERQTNAFTELRNNINSFPIEVMDFVLKMIFYFCYDTEDLAVRIHAFGIINLILNRQLQEEEPSSATEMILNMVYATVKRGLKNENESVRTDFLNLLNTLVNKFKSREPFSSLLPLLFNDNEDANVLLNILHLQQHRRARALKRLTEFAKGANLSRSVVEDIFLPLLTHFVFSDPACRDPISPLIVYDATIAMATLYRFLPIKVIIKRIIKYAEKIKRGIACEKALVRLIAETFRNMDSNALDQQQSSKALETLFNILGGNGERKKVFRPSIALAIGELIPKLENDSQANLIKLVSMLAAQLGHKLPGKREETQTILATVTSNLGSEYLPLIVKELKSLLAGGYRPHILAFTINNLLCKGKHSTGSLDAITENVTAIVIGDMFGERAREKDMKEWTGRIMEVKAKKSPETLAILASKVSINQLINILAAFKTATGRNHETDWTVTACNAIEKGLIDRVAVRGEETLKEAMELAPVLYLLLDDTLQFYTDCASLPHWKLHSSYFQLLGCKVLLHLLRQDFLTLESSKQFLSFLLLNLCDKSNAIMTASIKCLAVLLSKDQISTTVEESSLNSLLLRLFDLVIKSDVSRNVDLVNASFKLISILVRNCSISIGREQLCALFEYIRVNLENEANSGIAFSLIKAVLGRKVILPEVYELMNVIRKMILQSFFSTIRAQCRSIFLMFLLDYPLAKGKIEEHFAFFTANLSFEVDGGRESVAQFIGMLAEKLPKTTILEMGETWLLALAARLVNETNESIKRAIEETAGKVIARLDERTIERVGLLLSKWLDHSSSMVVKTGWTLLPVLISHSTITLNSLVKSVALKIFTNLNEIVNAERDSIEKGVSIESLIAIWSMISKSYFSLEVANLIVPLMALRFKTSDQGLAKMRTKIMSAYFTMLEGGIKIPSGYVAPDMSSWSKPWMKEVRTSDLETAELIVKNLLFISRDCPEMINSLLCKFETISRQVMPVSQVVVFGSTMCKFQAAIILTDFVNNLSDSTIGSILISANRVLETIDLHEDVRIMAKQVLDLLAHRIGAEKFDDLKVKALRLQTVEQKKRDITAAQLAVTDPVAFSKLKLSKRNKVGTTNNDM